MKTMSVAVRRWMPVVLVALLGASTATWATPLYHITDLGTLGGDESVALDINNSGTVVGWAQPPRVFLQAYSYQNGTMTGLGVLPNTNGQSVARGVNSDGTYVGEYFRSRGHAFSFDGSTFTDIGALPPFRESCLRH